MVETTLYLPQEQRLVFALLYLFGLVGGIILYLIAKDDKTQKFYAMQAILLGIVYIISYFTCCGFIFMFFYTFYIVYKIYTTGGYFVPYVSDYAMKHS